MPETGARTDPYSAFNFLVEVDGVTVAGFSECSGLTNETDPIDYRNGDTDTYVTKLPGLRKFPIIVLKRGFTDNRDLWEWRTDRRERPDRAAHRDDHPSQRSPRACAAVQLPRGLAVEVGRAHASTAKPTRSPSRHSRSATRDWSWSDKPSTAGGGITCRRHICCRIGVKSPGARCVRRVRGIAASNQPSSHRHRRLRGRRPPRAAALAGPGRELGGVRGHVRRGIPLPDISLTRSRRSSPTAGARPG